MSIDIIVKYLTFIPQAMTLIINTFAHVYDKCVVDILLSKTHIKHDKLGNKTVPTSEVVR